MRGLHKVEISDFKAFEGKVEFTLEGKHLLLYGENGSGKSSFFWALYTFLQSSVPNKNVQKYFNPTSSESLVNDFASPAQPTISCIFQQRQQSIYQLTAGGLSNSPPTDPTVSDVNLASDFISHRLLTGFYNFRNSEAISLFPVFLRDILPFWESSTRDNLAALYEESLSKRPFRLSGAKIVNKKSDWSFDNRLRTINTEIEKIINNLNLDLTKFYQDHFDDGKKDLEITLELQSKLLYERLIQPRTLGGNNYVHKASDTKEFSNPIIALRLKRRVNNNWKEILRPQAYLNEARLTAIGLSIRFLLVKQRPKKVDDKILVLDDVLVSLDMVNREKVINLLINEFAEEFQILLLTHDKRFFEYAKGKFKRHLADKVKYLEVHVNSSSGHDVPQVFENKSVIELAQSHFLNHDYGASANYLRKAIEEYLREFLHKHLQVNKDRKELSLKIKLDRAQKYASQNTLPTQLFIDLTDLLKNILNPQSHLDIDSAFFKQELGRGFQLYQQLCQIRHEVMLGKDEVLNLTLNAGLNMHMFRLELREDLRLLKVSTGLSWTSKSAFDLIHAHPQGTDNRLVKEHNLESFYAEACGLAGVPPSPDLFSDYKLRDGRDLSVVRSY